MKAYLLVGLGGAVGSMLRYGISSWGARFAWGHLPAGTLLVNVLGSFLLGLVLGLATQHLSRNVQLLLSVGLCGGFTTFSTFAGENVKLLQNNLAGWAVLYMVLSLVFGLLAFWAGKTLVTH